MRFSAFGFCLVLLASATASAQPPSTEPLPPPVNTTYFIVDASGSMKGDNQKDAMDLLRGMTASLPRGQPISVTYFGEKSDDPDHSDLCLEDIVPSKAIARESELPKFPEFGGGKTAIGNAIESILKEGVGSPVKLVVITDGAEECGADFAAIRQRYPDAEIKVLQVGLMPNSALQQMEIKLPQAEIMSPAPEIPTPAETSTSLPQAQQKADDDGAIDHWATASWWERYLWLVAYIFLASSAATLGISYLTISSKLEGATHQLERDRQKNAEQELREDKPEPKWPEVLTQQEIAEAGRGARIKSVSIFLFALVVGLPLALSSGLLQMFVGIATGLLVLFMAGWLLVTKPGKIEARWNDQASTIESVREPYLPLRPSVRRWLAFALVIAFAATYFGADWERARSAAWLVLSSNFSGMLAIVASAPLLFLGARWWSAKQASYRYYSVAYDVISEEIRKQRATAKKTALEWENLRGQLVRWSFPAPLLSIGRWWRQSIAQKNRDAVIERLKTIAMKAGGDAPSVSGIQMLQHFLSTRSLAGFIYSVVDKKLVEDEKTLWLALATALESESDKKITEAFSHLSKSVNRPASGA